jgi:hypothetical protein
VSLQSIIQWRQPVIYRLKSIINLEYNNSTVEEIEKILQIRINCAARKLKNVLWEWGFGSL